MKTPLKKSDRKRFDDLCIEIRRNLHILHFRPDYLFAKESHDEKYVVGRYHTHDAGDYADFSIYDGFWRGNYEWQLRVLIHEHVHAVLSPITQWYNGACTRLHPSDKDLLKDDFIRTDERVTHHLEAILFDLLKDRL